MKRLAALVLLCFAAAAVAQIPEARLGLPEGVGAHQVLYSIPADELVPLAIDEATKDGDERDWGLGTLKVPDAWSKTKGKGALVAVLDTGIDATHTDLKDRVKDAKDFSGARKKGAADGNGHGTHCAGVIAASEDGKGMVGVAPEAMLLAGKVLDDSGSGWNSDIARGIDWAVDAGADVISMSLGGPSSDSATSAAVQKAEAAGVIVIAAAGNSGPRDGTVGYPGNYPSVIAVAAVDKNEKVADFSSRGKAVYVAAPGVNVRSTYPKQRFASMSGTSMATPHVAGLAALWVSAHPEVKKTDRPAAFRKALEAAAKDLPPVGRDNASGYGLPLAPALVGGGTEPPPDYSLVPVIRWGDLTPAAQKRLIDAGLDPAKLK